MKKYLSAAFLFSVFFSSAQVFLTNAQVYNFDVGDIMQTQNFYAAAYSETYETNTVLGKVVSAGNDTIVYTLQVDRYMPQPCSACTPAYSSSVITTTITDLNSYAAHNNQCSFCAAPYDTLYTDACSRTVWEKKPVQPLGCPSNPLIEYTYVLDGAGGPYFNYLNHPMPAPGQCMKKELIYYQKNSGSCGTYITSVKEQVKEDVQLNLYPNPSTGQVQVSSSVRISYYEIVDTDGKIVISGRLSEGRITISGLDKGLYFANLYANDGRVFRKKLVKDQ